jgi:hypothetical protein
MLLCYSVSCCVHKYKGNWATNEMLITAGFCQQLLKPLVDNIRRQKLFAGHSRRVIWGVRNNLRLGGLLQHFCNVNEWVAVSTVSDGKQLFLDPGLPIPRFKPFMRGKREHDPGAAILCVTVCRTSAGGYHLQGLGFNKS